MRKADFIQHIIIRSLPNPNKVAAGVAYAEQLWQQLSELGYGATKQAQPRDNVNYYQQLNELQQQHFNSFWKAFNYKHDRNGAAMRWQQLGELSNQQYQLIIVAAKKESKRTLPFGQSRKMAQGWLAEMRYEDLSTSSTISTSITDNSSINNTSINNNNLAQRENLLQAELISVKRLYEHNKDARLADQITKIEQQLTVLTLLRNEQQNNKITK